MQKALNSSEYATRRLVMTESAFFMSASRKKTYDKLEVKQYKILVVLDTKTSTICRDMDGKVFDVKDYQPGLNANPFHANCRTTTTPYFNDKFAQQQERSARDENGKTYYVPTNMTYKEWYNKYVKDNQNVSAKDNTILKQQKQSIDTIESLHNQQMKQLEEMAQQQKEQLEQLQNVINQQKQQLKQLQNVAEYNKKKIQLENIKQKKITKGSALKQQNQNIKHDNIQSWQEFEKEYHIRNNIEEQDITREKKIVKEVIENMPKKVQQALKNNTIIDIGKKGASQYNYNDDILYIAKDATKAQIWHEIGHMVENKMMNSNKIEEMRIKIIGEVTFNDLYYDIYEDNTHKTIDLLFLKNDNLISLYQGRIYCADIFTAFHDDGSFKYDRMWEFIAEPFREYIENETALQQKCPELYQYIKEVVE